MCERRVLQFHSQKESKRGAGQGVGIEYEEVAEIERQMREVSQGVRALSLRGRDTLRRDLYAAIALMKACGIGWRLRVWRLGLVKIST